MSEKPSNIPEQISIYDIAEEQGYLTREDYEREGINVDEDGGLIGLENGLIAKTSNRVNLDSIPVSESSPDDFSDDDGETRITNERGQTYYIDHDNSDMYRQHDIAVRSRRKENITLIEETEEKDRRYLKQGTLVRNVKGANFRKGFTDTECMVKRVLNEEGKWPTVEGLNKYMALSEVRFSYRTGDGSRTLSFNPGELFMAPQKCEDKEKRNELLKKKKQK